MLNWYIFYDVDCEAYEKEKNVVEYSLMIDLNQEFSKDSGNMLISKIAEKSIDLCSPYYWNLSKVFTQEFTYSDDPFSPFGFSLMNHCILSALYTAKHIYLKNSYVSAYQIMNYLEEFGFWSMKDYLKYDRASKIYRVDSNAQLYDKIPTQYNGFRKKLSSVVCDEYWRAIYQKKDLYDISTNIPLESSDLFYRLTMAAPQYKIWLHAKNIIKKNTKSKIKNSADKYNEFIRALLTNREADIEFNCQRICIDNNAVDKVLLQYQIERIFFPSIIKTVISYWSKSDKSNNKNFIFGQELFNILSDVSLLPNVFSRDYIVKLMLDSLFDDTRAGVVKYQHFSNKVKVSTFSPDNTEIDFAINWREASRKSIYNLAFVTIPVMEKVFFILLYEHFKTTNSSFPIKDMMDCLYTYVKDHIDSLSCFFTDLDSFHSETSRLRFLSHSFSSKDISHFNDLVSDTPNMHAMPTIAIDSLMTGNVFKELFSRLFSASNYSEQQLKYRYHREFSKSYFGIDKVSTTDYYGNDQKNENLEKLNSIFMEGATSQAELNLYPIDFTPKQDMDKLH